MKVNGVEITSGDELLVLPRVTGGDLVFRTCAVDMGPFQKQCPEPEAPNIRTRDGFGPDMEDKAYVDAVKQHSELRFAYLATRSLEPSNIDWDEVDFDIPSTWLKWDTELKASGLSEIEMNRVFNCILSANALDEDKLEEARASFLRGLAQ